MNYTSSFIVVCFILISGCHKSVSIHTYFIKNKSNKLIYFNESSKYPDTSIQRNQQGSWINASEIGSSEINQQADGFSPSKKFYLFIFDGQQIKTLSWDTVVAKNLILKRVVFSQDSLQKLGDTLYYP